MASLYSTAYAETETERDCVVCVSLTHTDTQSHTEVSCNACPVTTQACALWCRVQPAENPCSLRDEEAMRAALNVALEASKNKDGTMQTHGRRERERETVW